MYSHHFKSGLRALVVAWLAFWAVACGDLASTPPGTGVDASADVEDPKVDALADAADASDAVGLDGVSLDADAVADDALTNADADAAGDSDAGDASDAQPDQGAIDVGDAEDADDAQDAVKVDIVVPPDVPVVDVPETDDVPVSEDVQIGDDTAAVDAQPSDVQVPDVPELDANGQDTQAPDGQIPDAEVPDVQLIDTQESDVQDSDGQGQADTSASDASPDSGADTADGGADVVESQWMALCFACHGDSAQGNPAPPKDLKGNTSTSTPAVGAHQSHLQTSAWRHEITCQECHPVPDPYLETHFNGKVDVKWGALAKTGTFDFTSLTCNAVYCHGGSLPADGTGTEPNKTPIWNVVDGSQEACGQACHSVPPGGKHPGDLQCQNCHGEVISAFDPVTKAATWKNPSLHVNGSLEVGNLNCTSCHGDAATNNVAPPKGTKGELLTTEPAVGAHQQHLNSSDWHKQVLCTDCHTPPASTAHANGIFDFAFSALASASGTSPTFDAGTVTCSSVYCHGETLGNPKAGGSVKHVPVWNQVDGTYDSCGQSCHTNPPAEPHPQNEKCGTCHGATLATFDAATQTATWSDPTLHVNGEVNVIGLTCTSCHGDPLANSPAPPTGTKGELLTTDAAVGAHQRHLKSSDWHRQVDCTDCHAVPESTAHANGQVELNWSMVAAADGAKPVFDVANVTCATTYCHGSTLPGPNAGGTLAQTPKWTQVDGTFESCGASCHTNPPGGKHPQKTDCATCHGDVIATYDATTKVTTWTNASLHVNGNVEVIGLSCTTCHGDAATNNPAPPKGTKGETLTGQLAVGAHQKHLGSSDWHREGQCTDCHVVPASTGHSNGTADLAWGEVATSGNSTPVFTAANATCSTVYCHGSSLAGPKPGGSAPTTPIWTTVDGTFASCGQSCHTNPPGGNHPQSTACTTCHTPVIATYDPVNQAATWANAGLHINGKVETAGLTCTSCHGDPAATNSAPPKGTNGELLTSAAAVGAHQQHLGTSDWHRAGSCEDCHTVPDSTLHTNGIVDVALGILAQTGAGNPTYESASLTCNAVYCHGNTLPDAVSGSSSKKAPKWTTVDGTYDSCGASCHTNPPGGAHPSSTACGTCHTDVITSFNAADQTAKWNDPTLHINGQIEVKTLTCTTCHGDAQTQDPAPPLGTHGEQLTTSPAVGAHQKHQGNSDWHRSVQCTDCHTVPEAVAHSNGAIDFAWGGPSAAGGAVPTFDLGNVTCSSVYCHGTTLMGPKPGVTLKQTPIWTQVDGTFEACGTSCHSTPPGPPHVQNTQCQTCHGAVISSFTPGINGAAPTVVWADASRHINGVVDAPSLTCTACHGDSATNNPAPPRGTKGETLTSQPAVGAHLEHLGANNWHRDVLCNDCHTVPSNTLHANGLTELVFGAIATTGGLLPTFDAATVTCSAVYCHGGSLPPAKAGGTTQKTPKWTTVDGTYDSCGQSCHTNPPGGAHPQSTACATCHGDVISSFVPATQTAVWKDKGLHVDGKLQVLELSCTTCHGDAATQNPAPPLGTQGETLTSQAAVGAHAQHLASSTWHRQGACTDCHTVPTSTSHANGQTEFTWGGPAAVNGAVPAYVSANVTCNTVYCHGNTLPFPAGPAGTLKLSPVWTTVDGTYDSCGQSCHTTPPGGSHPQNNSCEQCHGDVITSFTPGVGNAAPTVVWKNPARHVDGVIDSPALSCTACHGDPAINDPAPPKGTKGETLTSQASVGAHQQHQGPSTWHKEVQCTECHLVPASPLHADTLVDVDFGTLATAANSAATFDFQTLTCNAVYCHGNTLPAAKAGGTTLKTPKWTQVDGTYESCGASCHTNPPGGTHTQSTACASCHADVISAFDPATQTATWTNASLHVDGTTQVKALTCTSCHGNASTNDPAPPLGTKGETLTSQAAVGAHQQHGGSSDWHRAVQCADCHVVPASTAHANGQFDFGWAGPSAVGGASPAFDPATLTCNSVYCHGTTLFGANPGGTLKQTPVWTTVDGTYDKCGASCHTTPPGAPHVQNTQCQTCHGAVISSFTPGVGGAAPTVVWANASRHIDGVVDAPALSCTVCHGDAATNNPAPPKGTKGETATTDAAVGAHAQHLATANWHRDVQCVDCHVVPASTLHANGVDDVTFGALAATGTTPAFAQPTLTCNAVYCHGATLTNGNASGTIKQSPVWNTVNGTYDSCGLACHSTPPGGTHVASTDCAMCHASVVSAFNPTTKATTWVDRSLHINGKIESNKYHDLTGWTAPEFGTNHHGSNWFIRSQMRDEHGVACTQCHGANLDGGTVNVSCNNSTIGCHGANAATNGTAGNWKACNFCHGKATQNNPPNGVANETATNTLGVGRHTAHLAASSTHTAFACTSCHTIPGVGDINHILGYVFSANLTTTGHHGDVVFPAPPTQVYNTGAMTWTVATTTGNPITGRGTCTGSCHSNGRGGAPLVTPYWAGGTWTAGTCAGCHATSPTTGSHPDHSKTGNNVGCAACHPAATAATHMNGLRDVNATITAPNGWTGSVTTSRNATTGRVSCNGNCHGQNHTPDNW